jgi:hypothetical protein
MHESPMSRWRDGVVLALLPVLFGLFPLISGHFELKTRHGTLILNGGSARALGVAAIALGACVHFHNFWGQDEKLSPYCQPAMIAGALVFLSMLGYIAYAALL